VKKNPDIWLVLAAVLFTVMVALVAFLVGYYVNNGYTNKQFSIFNQAYQILSQNGLKPMPADSVTEYEMIRGMVKAYDDPYTVFIEPPQHELETQSLEGKYGGIGAALQKDTSGVLRVYPYPGSPAALAGVPAGSELRRVDQLVIQTDTPDDQVVAALRGLVGTKVTIKIKPQENNSELDITIVRSEFGIPSVTWQLVPENPVLGIVKITAISATTPDEVKTAISELKTRGVSTVILDVRDNGGGLVDSGIDLVKLFSPAGSDLMVQHYPKKPVQNIRTVTNGPYFDLPLYVFINGNTASSAEIVAGVLKELHRATVIGKPTFGKDTIQLVFDLKDGSSIHVTAARWSLPGIPAFTAGAGLQPDIPLPQESPSDADYIQAVLSDFK